MSFPSSVRSRCAIAAVAAIFYNLFGNAIKEFGARMEDFQLEFLNLTERSLER